MAYLYTNTRASRGPILFVAFFLFLLPGSEIFFLFLPHLLYLHPQYPRSKKMMKIKKMMMKMKIKKMMKMMMIVKRPSPVDRI